MSKQESKYRCYPNCDICCRIDKYSTEEEFNLAKIALEKQGIFLRGARMNNGLILWPCPCPALDTTKPWAKCRIYDVRPFPCRQFLCGKEFEEDKRPFKEDGTFNINYFNELLKNSEFRKVKEKLEDEAVESWGKKHGYKLEKVNRNG